jgi:hypothetical protein
MSDDRMTTDPREAYSDTEIVEIFDPGLSRALEIAKKVKARVDADRMDDLAILARAVFDMHERLEEIRSVAEDHRWD